MTVMTGHRTSRENCCQETCRSHQCPDSAQDRANFFAVAGRRHGWDIEVLYHLTPLLEQKDSLGEKWFCLEEKMWWRELPGFVCYRGFFVPFLIPSVIDTAAVAVCFLISLLFSVNSSYLNKVFSGNTKLENTSPKPQQPVVFKFLSQLSHVANVDFTS